MWEKDGQILINKMELLKLMIMRNYKVFRKFKFFSIIIKLIFNFNNV